MGRAHLDNDESQEQVAEDVRMIALLADAASDFECLGAEAAAEFGR